MEEGDEQPHQSAACPESASTAANPPPPVGASEGIGGIGKCKSYEAQCSWGGGNWTWGKPLQSDEPWDQVLSRAQV